MDAQELKSRYSMGVARMYGNGVEEDIVDAIDYLMSCVWEGASANNSFAGYPAAAAYHIGKKYFELYSYAGNQEQAERGYLYCELAARSGNIDAQEWLFFYHANWPFGDGPSGKALLPFPQNPITAFHWAEEAAKCKEARDLCLLGLCYEDGIGVVRDLDRACSYYGEATRAKGADANAFHVAGSAYERNQNYNEAGQCFAIAANMGDEVAAQIIKERYRKASLSGRWGLK